MNSFSQQFFEFARSVHAESRLRLAPTPSGFLHIGNALNFILVWLAAKNCGRSADERCAKVYLRIDDLDTDRNRPEYIQDIFDTLDWLKLNWDPAPPIYQSANLLRYSQILERLRAKGLLFACRKSRRDLEPFGHEYPLEFREQGLSLEDPEVAWRIKTPPDFPLPDFMVRRRDGIPAYQVASFADDIYFGITHIIRGADLKDSTAAQRFLAQVLSEDNFLKIKFLHHPLLLDVHGGKLSKSAGSTALKTMRDTGIGPEEIFQRVGNWLGLEGDSSLKLLKSMRQKIV
ncbi:MAG: glutamate--tRNA ligase family protein [Saprospiraceae bacterium]|nr:glutamate--tRNA ligase family protein [Saprospiraceae bacterium]